MSARIQPRLLVYSSIIAALAAMLVLEYQGARSEKITLPLPTQPSVAAQPSGVQGTPAHLQGDLGTILSRPLFLPSRRPPAADSTAAVADKLPRLSGVLVSQAGRWLIFDGPSGKPLVVTEGARVGGYVVRSIGDGQAVLDGPRGVITIRPSFGNAPASIAVAQPSILEQLLNAPHPSGLGLTVLQPPSRPAQ